MLHAVLTENAAHALHWPWKSAIRKIRHDDTLGDDDIVASYHGGMSVVVSAYNFSKRCIFVRSHTWRDMAMVYVIFFILLITPCTDSKLDISVFTIRPKYAFRLVQILKSAVYHAQRVDIYLIVTGNASASSYFHACSGWDHGRCRVTRRWISVSSAHTHVLLKDCVEISPWYAVWFSSHPEITTMGGGAGNISGVHTGAIDVSRGVAPNKAIWVNFTRWVIGKKGHPLSLFERYCTLHHIVGIYPIIDNGRFTFVRGKWQDPLMPQTIPYIARVWPYYNLYV